MAHWSGTRSGWNQRGGEQLSALDRVYENLIAAQEANPDSRYWQSRATNTQQDLCDYLGDEEYHLLAEMVWPGETIMQKTWKEIFETSQGYWLNREQIAGMLECSCNGVQPPCKVCQAIYRMKSI